MTETKKLGNLTLLVSPGDPVLIGPHLGELADRSWVQIPSLNDFILTSVVGVLDPILAVFGQEVGGKTLNWSPANRSHDVYIRNICFGI